MKTKFSLLSAIGLVTVWAMLWAAIPLTMNIFRFVNVEMPALTVALFSIYHLTGFVALPCVIMATAVLLLLRQPVGWFCAIMLCVVCDFAVLGLLLPIISLWNSVGSAFSPTSQPGVLLAIAAILLNQILLVQLLHVRREFFVSPKPEGTLLPMR